MTPAEVILSEKVLIVFRCFIKKMVIFGVVLWSVKSKVINLSFEDFLKHPYVTCEDLQDRKTMLARTLSCSMHAALQALHSSIERDCFNFNQTSLSGHWKTSFEKNCFSAWASTLNMGLINKS